MRRRAGLLAPLALLVAAVAPHGARAEGDALLVLERTIPLPDVAGRIDHLALDAAGKRLAVAALGNDSVEIVDLEAGRVVQSIRDIGEPQGVVFAKDGRLAVTSGEDGSLRTFDGKTWEPTGRVDLGGDADNLRLEASTGRLYAGYGDGGIAIVEGERKVAALPLPAHPESFQLGAGGRVYVNVPGAAQVVVLDTQAGRTAAAWPLQDARSNFPMALDEAHHRLLVGCRRPARLLVLDTQDGHVAASVEIGGDVDDIWIDAKTSRVYLSCGAGSIDVLERGEGDAYRMLQRVETPSGARTSLFDPQTRRLYLAVPRRGSQQAGIRVYGASE